MERGEGVEKGLAGERIEGFLKVQEHSTNRFVNSIKGCVPGLGH